MELQFDDVLVHHGKKAITEPLYFAVDAGSTTAIVGPSQSGKSALLLYASGYVRPRQGHVSLVEEGQAQEFNWRYVGLGPIPKFAPLFDTLTVFEQIRFQTRLHKVRQPSRRAEELLEMYDLADLRNERVKDIHRLAYARLSIAVSMCHHPQFLLLDEPENGLTETEWNLIVDDFHRLNHQDVGILFTTVLESAAEAAGKVVSLPSGEVTVRWRYSPSFASSGSASGATS